MNLNVITKIGLMHGTNGVPRLYNRIIKRNISLQNCNFYQFETELYKLFQTIFIWNTIIKIVYILNWVLYILYFNWITNRAQALLFREFLNIIFLIVLYFICTYICICIILYLVYCICIVNLYAIILHISKRLTASVFIHGSVLRPLKHCPRRCVP